MEKIMKLKGTNGTIIADADKVIIQRKGFIAFATQKGLTGNRTYFYKDINAVEFKKPGLTNGYMKFILAGTIDSSATTGLFKTSQSSMQDQNTVILRAFKKSVPKLSEDLYNFIMENILKCRNSSNTVIQASSNLDELKKLSGLKNNGVISEKEFEDQKKKLLSN